MIVVGIGVALGVLLVLVITLEWLALFLPLGLAALAVASLFVVADDAREVGMALLAAGATWTLTLTALEHVVNRPRLPARRDRGRRGE